MEVRPLRADEAATWRDLRLRALTDSPDAFRSTLAEEAPRLEADWVAGVEAMTADPDRVALLGELEGGAAGMAFCRIDSDRAALAHVGAMWVAPEVRRQRLGRLLLEHALAFARSRGASDVELSVTEGNEAARHLYESFGFADTGRREPLRTGSSLTTFVLRRSTRY